MAEFSLKKMGERLKQIRVAKGFGGDRQGRAFCREYKLNASVWGQLEKGEKKALYIQTVAAYCQQFEMSPTWLLFGIGPEALSDIQTAQPLNTTSVTPSAFHHAISTAVGQKRTDKVFKDPDGPGTDKGGTRASSDPKARKIKKRKR